MLEYVPPVSTSYGTYHRIVRLDIACRLSFFYLLPSESQPVFPSSLTFGVIFEMRDLIGFLGFLRVDEVEELLLACSVVV